MQHCTRTTIFLILLVALGLTNGQSSLSIILRRAPGSNVITLECRRGGSILPPGSATYLVRAPPSGNAMQLLYTLEEQGSVSFVITPDREGTYFCRDSDNEESGELQLIAFPEPNPGIEQVTNAAAQVGDALVSLQCEFEVGRLSQLYTIDWYKGSSFSPLPQNTKYQVNQNTLLIKNVVFEDEGDYRCEVIVDNPMGNSVFGMGRNIYLEVYDEVTIVEDIGPKRVVQENGEVEFLCKAEGRPTPDMVWLFNGNDLQGDIFETFGVSDPEMEGDLVTSTLTVTQARDIHSGEITCVATNKPVTLDETFTANSTTILTVLSNNIENLHLTTALQNNIVYVHFTLPALFQEDLTLVVVFMDEDSSQSEDEEFRGTGALNNTRDVHYQFPTGQLPSFSAFRVKIALRLGDEEGPFTAESNPIEKGVEPLQPSEDSVKDLIPVIVCGCVVLIGLFLASVVLIKCKKFEFQLCHRNNEGDGGQFLHLRIGTDTAVAPDAVPDDYGNLTVEYESEPCNLFPREMETQADHTDGPTDPDPAKTQSPDSPSKHSLSQSDHTDSLNKQSLSPVDWGGGTWAEGSTFH